MKTLSILTTTILLFSACNSTPPPNNHTVVDVTIPKSESLNFSHPNISIPSDSSQLLFVTTSNWSAKNGTLQRYERVTTDEAKWVKIGEPITIILGRNGLGWGRGLHTIPTNAKYVKREGDGKAPAGLFYLGNAFGYEDFRIDFPYEVYKTTDHCVDDSHSQWYNKIVDSKKVTKDYKSFEHMRLKNNLYRYGITVNHNPNQIKNAGSCIFMHIRSDNGKGTAGCTAMKENKLTNLLIWLKKEAKPLLLQLPKSELRN